MQNDLKTRTKTFALEIVGVYTALPKRPEAQVLGHQMRSGTSVDAHYREAQRAKSDADFVSKMEGGLQELEETGYWVELLTEFSLGPIERLNSLKKETEELIAIFVTIVKKTKSRLKFPKH
jgi:four helix bundle protein